MMPNVGFTRRRILLLHPTRPSSTYVPAALPNLEKTSR
jgi:hypothetical protein